MLVQNGPGMAGEDASLDSAVQAITAKLRGGAEGRPDARENREDRDTHERQQPSDLEELERLDAEERAAAENQDGKAPAEVESEDGEEAGAADDAQFIELPAAEDGADPERVPLTEAIEAVKQLRQMNGEIATAVIRAEEEAYQKQDQVTQQLAKTFETVQKQARVALQLMGQFLPQPPSEELLNRNSQYYDPEGYWVQRNYYDEFVAHKARVEATLRQAGDGLNATNGQQDQEMTRRELERAARFIPEFKDEKSREAKKSEWLEVLGAKYGLDKATIDEIGDHRALRMMNDLANALKAQKKAPEVKKHLQETRPKIVNGRAPTTRDPQTGQFISQARKELKETGSEDAFARMLMRSGALKNL